MASRAWQRKRILDPDCAEVTCRILFGSAGAATLQAWDFTAGEWVNASGAFMGIKSVTKSATGDYVIRFTDNYNRFYSIAYEWEGNSGLPVLPFVGVKAFVAAPADSDESQGLGSTIELITSAPVLTPSLTYTPPAAAAMTQKLSGFTGTTTTGVTTITAGGAVIAAHALAGGTLSDGTTESRIIDNTALTATTGTITTVTGLAATITATGAAWVPVTGGTISGTVTGAGAAANPASGDILNLSFSMSWGSAF